MKFMENVGPQFSSKILPAKLYVRLICRCVVFADPHYTLVRLICRFIRVCVLYGSKLIHIYIHTYTPTIHNTQIHPSILFYT